MPPTTTPSVQFERADWNLFRTLPTLCQKAGVPQSKLARLVGKELADNGLDAGANVACGTASDGGFFIEDDGPGIPGSPEEVAALFSIARPMASTKLVRLPTRGALGNGLRVVAGAVLASGGALEVCTVRGQEPHGMRLRLAPQDDGTTRILSCDPWDRATAGTRVAVRLGGPLASIGPDDALAWARGAITISRTASRYQGSTSAWWYDSDAFYEMLLAAGSSPLGAVVALFDGFDRPRDRDRLPYQMAAAAGSISRSEAEALLAAMRTARASPKPRKLGAVGAAVRGWKPRAYAKAEGTFTMPAARGSLPSVIPYVAEAWSAPNDDDGSAEMVVYANRSPITADVHFWHEDGQAKFYGCNVGVSVPGSKKKKLGFRLCVTAPHLPITSDGKSPDLSFMRAGIAEALAKAARGAKKMIVMPDGSAAAPAARTSLKDLIFAAIPAGMEKASGSGEHRYSLRQLFYAVRPALLEAGAGEPNYDTFCRIVGEYEAIKGGDLPGMYRDPRGTVYHPHTGEEIPLGTQAVERYRMPQWTFNKVLYIEKEGLAHTLRAARWPERNDCAILSSKGFASRAARDLLDLMGDGEEEITFYCVHDADAYGTMIYQSLQEATRARPGRRVRIVNLGLEPSEAVAIGLQVEPVTQRRKAKSGEAVRAPVAAYVPPRWADWLQTHRIELNAMTSPEFVAWLDRKFEVHCTSEAKVVPPARELRVALEASTREKARARLVAEILQRAGIDSLVEAEMARAWPALAAATTAIGDLVRSDLELRPEDRWTDPVDRIAERIARGAF